MFLRSDPSDLGVTGQLLARPYRGALSNTAQTNTTAGGTNIQITQTAGGTALSWFTFPVGAVTIAGSITVNVRGLESAGTVNAGPAIEIQHCNAAGSVLGTILATTAVTATEYTTSDGASNASFTPTSTAIANGDRIQIILFVTNAGGTMTVGTVTNSYSGQITGIIGDTYVTFTETLNELVPSGNIWVKQYALGATIGSNPGLATFAQSLTPGNYLVAIGVSDDSSGNNGFNSVYGGGVTTWTRQVFGSSNHDCELWMGQITSTASTTVAFNDVPVANETCVACIELEGVWTTSPVVSTNTTAATSASISGPTQTVAAGQIVIQGVFPAGGILTPYLPTSTGWTGMQSGGSSTTGPSGAQFCFLAWTQTTGSQTATWTQQSSTVYQTVGAVLNAAPTMPLAWVSPAVIIGESTPVAPVSGFGTSGAFTSGTVNVPAGAMIVVTNGMAFDASSVDSVVVTNSGTARTWTRLLAVNTGGAGEAETFVDYWWNSTGSTVSMTVTSTYANSMSFTKYCMQEIEVLTNIINPSITPPNVGATITTASVAEITTTPTAVGSLILFHVTSCTTSAAYSSYVAGTAVNTSPASTVYNSGQQFASAVMHQTASNATSGSPITMGAAAPTGSVSAGGAIEYFVV